MSFALASPYAGKHITTINAIWYARGVNLSTLVARTARRAIACAFGLVFGIFRSHKLEWRLAS